MSISKGKQFENKFFHDWQETFLDSFIYRLNDQVSGYKSSSRNICDFICFNKDTLYLIECKSSQDNTWNFSAYSQYEKQLVKVGIPGVRVGVVLWMVKHDTVVYLPTKTIQRMKAENKKSFNIKDLDNDTYRIIKVPSIKKRVFMDSDYSILFNLKEGD